MVRSLNRVYLEYFFLFAVLGDIETKSFKMKMFLSSTSINLKVIYTKHFLFNYDQYTSTKVYKFSYELRY